MFKKGFSIILIVVIVLVVIAGGVLAWQYWPEYVEQQEEMSGVELQDFDLARSALVEYFSLLNEGRYSEAVKYHGSEYDYMNTSIGYESKLDSSDSNNHAELLRRGCQFLICLKIKKIVDEKEISRTHFKFTVQFAEHDGMLFERSHYCCGEEPPEEGALSPQVEFDYTVEKKGDAFFVITPIVYVP